MEIPAAVEQYLRHVADVRRLSPATVRAYRSDLVDLADATGPLPIEDVDLEVLRNWMWRASERGDARSTLARRAAAVRTFFAWALDAGLINTNPAVRLVAPKRGRTLPKVASAEGLSQLLDDLGESAREGGDAVELRDHAMLELLYGAALRVSELCALDLTDLDAGRRTARVWGKGSKERVVPYGGAAARALDAYLVRGRPALAGPAPALAGSAAARSALFLGVRGARIGSRTVYDVVARRVVWERRRSTPMSRASDSRPAIASRIRARRERPASPTIPGIARRVIACILRAALPVSPSLSPPHSRSPDASPYPVPVSPSFPRGRR